MKVSCLLFSLFLASIDAQSLAPSSAPSVSMAPTTSAMPSSTPTTSHPSSSPTDTSVTTPEPSGSPSEEETSDPTSGPTVGATEAAMTSAPAPTSMPSMDTTDVPSADPTAMPSADPTKAPTDAPTEEGATAAPTVTATDAPTPAPSPSPTDAPTVSPAPTIPRECSAYNACAALADDCCPTVDDIFLYCCFEPENPGTYGVETSLVAPSGGDSASYLISTSTYFDPGTAPNGDFPVVSYVRSPTEVYDLIYYETGVIADASDFTSGRKKFYVDIYSLAPVCTQILLQLDNLALSTPDNFPIGRHSRYVAATTKQGEWERLEFDFLDRPDEVIGDDQIDSIALFFGPGLLRADSFYFRNLDIAAEGCTVNCETPSPKSCQALFAGEDGACADGIDNDNDGLVDCEDTECTLDAECSVSVRMAYASAKSQVRAATNNPGSSASRLQLMTVGTLLGMASIVFALAF